MHLPTSQGSKHDMRPDAQPSRPSGASFDQVSKQVRPDVLSRYASELREQRKESHEAPPQVLNPIYGSSHVLYPIRFDNHDQWIFKLPFNGVESQWDAFSANALRSEACSISLMRKETKAPLPEVISYSVKLENEIGCPYMLMTYVDGLPLDVVWFEKSSNTDVVNLEWIRSRVLQGIAKAMIQLDKYTGMYGATILYDETGSQEALGPIREINKQASLKRRVTGESSLSPLYAEVGPFADPKQAYTCMLEPRSPTSRTYLGAANMIRLLVSWIPEHDGAGFVMTHPRLDMDNILVSRDGDILGIVGWTDVHAVPRTVGNERYPAWLSRDWSLAGCAENAASTGTNAYDAHDAIKHAREELAHYRNVYHQWLVYEKRGREPLRFKYDDDREREDDEKNKYEFDATQMSLVSTNLYAAARELSCLLPALFKDIGDTLKVDAGPELSNNVVPLLSKLLKELAKESGVNYGFYDLAGRLADNTGPCQSHMERLKRAFRTLLKRRKTQRP